MKTIQKLYLFCSWALLLLLFSGCSANKIADNFDNNIEQLKDFYGTSNNDANYEQILHADYEELDKQESTKCTRADINTQDVNLGQLAKLLSASYHVNVNYAYDPNEYKEKKTLEAQGPMPYYMQNVANAVEDSKFSDKIHLNMRDVCLQDIFKALVEIYDVGVKQVPYGYLLSPRQLRTETFVVDYHNFYRKGKSSIAIVNSQLKSGSNNGNGKGSGDSYSSISAESEDNFWGSISRTIRSILSADRARKIATSDSNNNAQNTSVEDFYVYKESGLVVVTAYPKQLKYIREFLNKVNRHSTQQVLIETKILEVELSDEFSNGIQWDLLKSKINFSSFAALGQTITDVKTLHKTMMLSNENDLGTGAFSATIKNQDNFEAVLKALAGQGKISVMSSPRVLALNNQRALIKSGQDEYFVTNVSNTTIANGQNSNITGKSGFDLEPFFSGIALDTTPNILTNSELLLHIHPMISRVENESKSIKIDDKNTTIPVAMIQSREADTVIRARSGDIIILGGMTQNLVKLRSTGAPIAAGKKAGKLLDLFSSKKYLSKKIELIILIKPTIVKNFNDREDIATFALPE